MSEWSQGYWFGVGVLTFSLLLTFRPDLFAKPLRAAADWLDSKPVYHMTAIPGRYSESVSAS